MEKPPCFTVCLIGRWNPIQAAATSTKILAMEIFIPTVYVKVVHEQSIPILKRGPALLDLRDRANR